MRPVIAVLVGVLALVLPAASWGSDGPTATISRNPARLQGADAEGRILVYTPDPAEAGSSVSHWDRRASPNLLMEPALAPGPNAARLDVTPAMMEDIGWTRGAAEVVVIGNDFPGLGLEDLRPFAGAPGNPATTLGEARRVVLEAALEQWASTLESSVPIEVLVQFSELFCEPEIGAVLAGAGPLNAFADLEGLPHPEFWYPAALAESLVGRDLTGPPTVTGGGDIGIAVNAFIDEGCLGPGRTWYYGLDNNAPAEDFDLLAVLLHELAHGLGMLTLTDAFSGEELAGRPTIYDRFLYDPVTRQHWSDLDDEGRFWSAHRHGRLAWDGPKTRAAAPEFLAAGAVELVVDAGGVESSPPVVPAEIGIVAGAATAELACADDQIEPVRDGCSPLSPATAAGRIVLVDRGGCSFEEKATRVQAAGGVGMILVNTEGDTQLFVRAAEGGSAVSIPVVSVGRAFGNRLEHYACPASGPPLAAGRFDVRAVWFNERDFGEAVIRQLTNDTVFGTFFDSANVELVIKVLDACSVPQNDSFWVFAAGLTNLGVQIQVTDTLSGLSNLYANPPDVPFAPVQDTAAFPICD